MLSPMLAALATTAAAGAAIIAIGLAGMRWWRRHGRATGRTADWVLSLAISTVLSFVMGAVMTAVNVPVEQYPGAFLTSLLIGILVSTPTAYLVVPRISATVRRT